MSTPLLRYACWIAFSACISCGPPEESVPAPGDSMLFIHGCPVEGKSSARKIDHPGFAMEGPDALGGRGDYLLMNANAAFVVVRPNPQPVDTYYYYGGILVDAVALDGCAQASPERFEEMVPAVGQLELSDFYASVLRSFRAERAEVLNDGADGGPAIVRMIGTDDLFYLVEYELMAQTLQSGGVKPLSGPLGLEIFVDYILPPDSNVLRIEISHRNLTDQPQSIVAGTAMFFGDETKLRYSSNSEFSLAGFSLPIGIPWLVADGEGGGAWAFGMANANLASINISGVDAVIDFDQLFDPLALAPAGQPGDAATQTYFMSVGPTDAASALGPLHEANPQPLEGWNIQRLETLGGVVTDAGDGSPIAGASVEVQTQIAEGRWGYVTGFTADANGVYGGAIPDLGADYRLIARAEGRSDSEPVYIASNQSTQIDIRLDSPGILQYQVIDDEGFLLPFKLTLWKEGQRVLRHYAAAGQGQLEIPAGDYEISLTRGFEYAPVQGEISLRAGSPISVNATLSRAVNTAGYLSADGHMHAGPSTDNKISIVDRIASIAGEGLEIPIATEHRFVADWTPGVEALGLEAYVQPVIGQEVTAAMPGHMNVYPLQVRNDIDRRGGHIDWIGRGMPQIIADSVARGAAIIQLNHPRSGVLSSLDYDRKLGAPRIADAELTGLPAGTPLWSWDFNAIEYMNGNQSVFLDPENPRRTGTFEDWMSFLNHGRFVTALAGTDVHDYGAMPGAPRFYFASASDNPWEMDLNGMISSIYFGDVVVSTGAFARVAANGSAGMGDLLADTDGTVDFQLHVEALEEIDVTEIKVFVNCDEAISMETEAPDGIVKLSANLLVPVERDAHIVAMGFGQERLPRGLPQFDPAGVPRFTTNAIFIDADGDGVWTPPGGKFCDYDLP